MGKGTLLFLVLLVAALGGLWLVKAREAALGGPRLEEYPLCPGLVVERVRAVRIDHLERSFQLKLERDAAGAWYLTDPLAYPAQGQLVRTLLTSLAGARAEPATEADPAQVGLAPPRVVLECVQVEPGAGEAGERTLRVELGAVDLVSSLVYARVPAHPALEAGGSSLFRTTRTLVNTLERNPDDYRLRRTSPLEPQELVSIRRRGVVYLAEEGKRVDLAFDALLGPDGWKRVGLPTVSLDPQAMGLFARGATDLVIERFADDSPQDLTRWGLDPPLFTLELEPLQGKSVVLAFGHPPTADDRPMDEYMWFCQRLGFAHVWEVRTRDVELLTRPARLFFDQMVVRALRSDVARLELEGGGAKRVLQRQQKAWSVWEERAGDESTPLPGDAAAIEEALAQLERVQLAEHLEDEVFEPSAPPLGFTLVLANGARLGGALGRPTRDPRSGGEGLQFLRADDEVVALIDAAVGELCARPLEAFRSRRVHRFLESQVRSIELEHAGQRFAFVNDGDNLWSPRGEALQAPAAFRESLDGLLNLGARAWPSALGASEELLRVHLQPLDGEPTHFSFARGADGRMLCLSEGGPAAEVDAALVERLLTLF